MNAARAAGGINCLMNRPASGIKLLNTNSPIPRAYYTYLVSLSVFNLLGYTYSVSFSWLDCVEILFH